MALFNGKGKPVGRDLFSTGAIAAICSVAPRTVAKWCDSGQIKTFRLPPTGNLKEGERRVTRQDLIRFLKANGFPLHNIEAETFHQVLLIGLSQSMARKLTDLLPEDARFAVRHSPNAFHAGVDVQSIRPDTIVIDLGMGRSEALQIVHTLRQQDTYTETLIFALAGEDETESDKLLEQYDLNAVFRKPVNPADLAEVIGQGTK